jgi:hypothetical protein
MTTREEIEKAQREMNSIIAYATHLLDNMSPGTDAEMLALSLLSDAQESMEVSIESARRQINVAKAVICVAADRRNA